MLHAVIMLVQCFQCFSQKSQKHIKKQCSPYLFPPEGNFDIDAGDGGGGGPFRTNNPNKPQNTQKITKFLNNIVRTKIVHTSGTCFQKC